MCIRDSDVSMLPPRRGRKPLQSPAVEAWLESLRAEDARIHASEPAVAELERALALWFEFAREANAPARATFRLSDVLTEHIDVEQSEDCLLYTSPSPRDRTRSRMPS